MSKFFKALETADRERRLEADREPPAPSAPERHPALPGAEPVATAPTPPACVVEVRSADPVRAPEPVRSAEPVTVEPPAAVVVAATAVVEEPPVITVPPPREDTRPARAASAYGSPLSRHARAHTGAFPGVRDPAANEPGELDDHLVSLLEPTSYAAEQYRTARLHIENVRRERDVHVVAISSPGRGDGKTTTAINLAGALAQSPDARVVLVEMDLRHPRMAGYLGVPAARGLSGYLLDPAMSVEEVIERPAGIGFAVVSAGPPSSMPYELLKAPRLRALLAALRERFDFVVVDTPPVHPFPDVGILKDVVDGFVLVVRANQTPRELVRDSVQAVGTPRVLGLIFNDDERTAGLTGRGDGARWRGYLGRPLGAMRAA